MSCFRVVDRDRLVVVSVLKFGGCALLQLMRVYLASVVPPRPLEGVQLPGW